MSEFGKILNSAIDAAQELAGDMKAATDKMIDTASRAGPKRRCKRSRKAPGVDRSGARKHSGPYRRGEECDREGDG